MFNDPKPGQIPPAPPREPLKPDPSKSVWDLSRLKWGNHPVDKTGWTPIGTQPESDDQPDWRGVVKKNIIACDPPEPYKFGPKNDPKYFWFDTPDYADPFKKLWYAFRWFTYTGLIIHSVAGALRCYSFNVPNNLFLFKKYTWPWILAGMAASTTAVTVANLRGKKDDLYNYAAAGAVMGSIIGRENHLKWFRWTLVSIPLVMAVKYNAEINGKLFPVFDPRMITTSITGSDAEHGFFSGDLRFGFRGTNSGDPGRDVRKVGP